MRWIRAALRWVLTALLLALCTAMFYLLVIMGDTNTKREEPDAGAGRTGAVCRDARRAG